MYTFIEADLFCKEDLLVELNLIPYKKKTKISNDKFLYQGCILTKNNFKEVRTNKLFTIINKEKLSINKNNIYFCYSDGGSYNNGYRNKNDIEIGSFSSLIYLNNQDNIFDYSSAKKDITNNYSELTASLNCLRYLDDKIKDNEKIILVSDSQYVIKSINEWLSNWIKRGWKNNEGKPTPNKELWQEMELYLNKFDIYTLWCRGHQKSDNKYTKYNNLCDIKCNEEINKILLEEGKPIRKLKI